MSVSFQGVENAVLTFEAGAVTVGWPVALTANNKVANAPTGAIPLGIALNKRSDHAAVQFRGYAEANYSGSVPPALGWNSLVANGSGGLRVAGSGESGRSCLVVNLDTTDKVMGLFL